MNILKIHDEHFLFDNDLKENYTGYLHSNKHFFMYFFAPYIDNTGAKVSLIRRSSIIHIEDDRYHYLKANASGFARSVRWPVPRGGEVCGRLWTRNKEFQESGGRDGSWSRFGKTRRKRIRVVARLIRVEVVSFVSRDWNRRRKEKSNFVEIGKKYS